MSAVYPEPDGEDFTDGWSGSDASHERAVNDQKTGKARQHREQTVSVLAEQAGRGLTYQELGDLFGWHHGQSSGVLSVLHKERRIARLQDRRNRCHIYVLPEYVDGRETREAGRTAANRDRVDVDPNELADRLTAASDAGYDLGYRTGHDTGWIEGRDAGRGGALPEIEAAYHQGSDTGWQVGYDTAMTQVGDVGERVRAAFDDGTHDGSRSEAQRILRLTIEMRRTIDEHKRANGLGSMHRPYKNCWIEHPACALIVIEKALALSLPPKEVAS